MKQFTGVKVFSATMVAERMILGEKVTTWLEDRQHNPSFEVADVIVTQSSDNAFHCIAITVFYSERMVPRMISRVEELSGLPPGEHVLGGAAAEAVRQQALGQLDPPKAAKRLSFKADK